MEKIVAVTFDIADQKCEMYNALEWHNFIADTREYLADNGVWVANLTPGELFGRAMGDEFWFEVLPNPSAVYQVGFDLTSEEFVLCENPRQEEFYMEMAEEAGYAEEVFWAE